LYHTFADRMGVQRQKVCRKSFTRSYKLKVRIKNDLASTLVYGAKPSTFHTENIKTKCEERKVRVVLFDGAAGGEIGIKYNDSQKGVVVFTNFFPCVGHKNGLEK
jgi:hypothetical protein